MSWDLRPFYGHVEPEWVLPGMAENIIRILVPEDHTEPRGFHDVLLENMTTKIVPAASAGDMSDLRRLWHKLNPCWQECRIVRLTWSRSAGSVGAGITACDQAHVLIVGGSLSSA